MENQIKSQSGRFYIVDKQSGRKFLVEPIGKPRTDFGDSIINQHQEPGSIDKKDSIITEENNFKNIKTLNIGESPISYINQLLNNA